MDEMKLRVDKQANVATKMSTALHSCNRLVERIETNQRERFKSKTKQPCSPLDKRGELRGLCSDDWSHSEGKLQHFRNNGCKLCNRNK